VNTPDTDFTAAPGIQPTAALAVTPKARTLQVMLTLIKREFWEYRALWMAPLLTAAFLVLSALASRFHLLHIGVGESLHEAHPESTRSVIFSLMEWGLTVPIYLVMVIVQSFYLLGCLSNERKDRSILFWKSLPVSDTATVLSKLLVATVIVPLGVYVLALVTNLLFSAIAIGHAGVLVSWDTALWLRIEGYMLFGLVLSILWYAPLAALLLLVSGWARRNAFLWTTLPPLLLAWAERAFLGTTHVVDLIQYRTAGVTHLLGLDTAIDRVTAEHLDRSLWLKTFFDSLQVWPAITNIDLWLGVLAAAVFTFAAIRIRRYRDDS